MNNQDTDIELTYDQAVVETEAILNELESQQLPIDQILAKSKRVVALIANCRKEISKVSDEVDNILSELKQNESKTNSQEQ